MYTKEQMLAFGSAVAEVMSGKFKLGYMAIILRKSFPEVPLQERVEMIIEALGFNPDEFIPTQTEPDPENNGANCDEWMLVQDID